jgi:hypothetical protein
MPREQRSVINPTVKTVIVHVRPEMFWPDDPSTYYFGGRLAVIRTEVTRAPGLPDWVRVISGGFKRHGGRGRNPKVAPLLDTILEIEGVPALHHDLNGVGVTVVTKRHAAANRKP